MPRASKNSRFPGRRSVSYLIAVGAVGLVGAAPLFSAAPALANPTATVDITVQAGDVAHVTLPGNGNYGLYDVPDCGHASWLGPAYSFDATDCAPHTTVNNLIDWDTDTDITVNITVTPAVAPLALPTTPATPSVFSSIGQLTITWAAADVAEQVDGYEYTINGGNTWTAGTSGATVTGLMSGTIYQVGVRSHNASGYSLPSAYSPVMTMFPIIIPPTPPVPPTPVLAAPSQPALPAVTVNSATGALTITWAAANPAEVVDRYEYTTNGGTTWTTGTSPTTTSGLSAGLYEVGIRTHNATGYSAASAYAPALVLPVIVPPAPPSTPTVTPPAAPGRPVVTAGQRLINIAWPAVTAATSYEYSLNGGQSWSVPTTQRSVTVTGLQDGHTYTVQVRALTGTVSGAASATVSVKTKAAAQSQPSVPSSVPSSVQQPGSHGADVVRIQTLLGVPADGIYGPQTAAAVRSFQAARHLQVDGIVGRQTWTALLGGGNTTTPTTATRPWLQLGSTGSYVREAQQRLGGLVVDGVFGAQTRTAVVMFQARHHLSVDGIVGGQTWTALLGR